MYCASDGFLYVLHMCKRIFKFELQLSSYWQNTKFSRYCPKFHILTKIVIFQVYLQLFRPTASSLYIYQEYFFIFASCEPLSGPQQNCQFNIMIMKRTYYCLVFSRMSVVMSSLDKYNHQTISTYVKKNKIIPHNFTEMENSVSHRENWNRMKD